MSGSETSPLPSSDGASASPSLPPSQLDQLRAALNTTSGKQVLEHCLGLEQLKADLPLADSMVVVCLDTESWTHDHGRLTKIGVATFDSRDMRAVSHPGMYGEELLKQIYFYHARIEENAHLLNIKFCPGNPDSNRFGQTRFVNTPEACQMMDSIFHWPIDPAKPHLGNCPIVLMGHALKGDLRMLSDTLGIRATTFDTVVKAIDTQNLCREAGYWSSRQQPSLLSLVGKCGFEYRDAHTACNDAAMTLICGIQMVLPAHLKLDADTEQYEIDSRALQDVVDAIEQCSKGQNWNWGVELYCTRCAHRGHTRDRYRGRNCYAPVKCEYCAASSLEKRIRAAKSHTTKNCIFFALRGAEVSA